MSDSEDQDLEELLIAFGQLEVRVRSRRREQPVPVPARAADAAAAEEAPAGVAAGYVEAAEGPTEDEILNAATAAQLGRLDLPELRAFAARLRGDDLVWTPRARIHRAYRAGLLARRRLEGRGEGFRGTPETPYRVLVYVVLRPRFGLAPFWTSSTRTFYDGVAGRDGEAFAREVVCQGLASQAEARAYVHGSGEPWPEQRR